MKHRSGNTRRIAAHGSPRQHARFLFEISDLLSRSPSETEFPGQFAQVASAVFCDLCAVHLDDGEGKLTLRAVRDKRARHEKTTAALESVLDARRGFVQEAMRAGQPLRFHRSTGKDSVSESAQRLLLAAGMRSIIVVPILVGSVPAGTLSFLESSGKQPFGPGDVECAVAVARQVATALENIKLREQDRRISARSRLLGDATDKLFSTSDQAEMVQRLLDVIADEFADWVVAAQIENDALRLIGSAPARPEDMPTVSRIAEGSLFSDGLEQAIIAALREVRPMLVNEVGDQARAWMMAPLLVGGHEYGAVLCYSFWRRYDKNDLDTLHDLCQRASLALEFAHSFARERRLSQTLQRATLPPNLADVPGATVSSVYLTASQEEQVGGDWYDAFAIDDHRVLATIGDVTGHGLEASAIMVKLRHALNVVAKYETDPARILDIVEEVVLQRYPDAIATAFVAIIDTTLGTVTYANAGHPHPILRLADGSIRHLSADGLPIGLRAMHRSKAALTASLDGVEAIVFYTDGLIEVTRNVIEGQRWLANALASDAVPYLSDLAEFVKSSCLRGSLPDDVAVLAINFANVARWKFSSNDALAGREARHAFRRALGERGLPLDDLLGAELIFGELLSNAARHAGGEVQFALDWREGEPILHMIDRGPGYRLDKNVPDVLAERGRGLWLIECMGGKLEVEPLPGYGSHTRVLVSNARELLSA